LEGIKHKGHKAKKPGSLPEVDQRGALSKQQGQV